MKREGFAAHTAAFAGSPVVAAETPGASYWTNYTRKKTR